MRLANEKLQSKLLLKRVGSQPDPTGRAAAWTTLGYLSTSD